MRDWVEWCVPRHLNNASQRLDKNNDGVLILMQAHEIAGGGGLKLHVREWGTRGRPAVLMIHGWSQNHLSWQCQFNSELADSLHLVALDNRGHGMSEAPGDAASYADSNLWADDIAAIIRHFELDRPVLVGWSYGGLIMSDYVRVHGQEGISGIVFAGAATVLNDSAFGTLIGPGFLENFGDATSADLPTSIAAMRRFLAACFEVPLSTEDHETALAYNMVVRPDVRGHLGSRNLDNTDILQSLQIPVLASHGRKDVVVLPAAAEYIAEHCATAECSWYDDVGHAPFLEAPERFNTELAEFVERCRT